MPAREQKKTIIIILNKAGKILNESIYFICEMEIHMLPKTIPCAKAVVLKHI